VQPLKGLKLLLHGPEGESDDMHFLFLLPTLPHGNDLFEKTLQRLDPNLPLSTTLKHRSFIEFPAIDVWESESFNGAYVDLSGDMIGCSQGEPPRKRRELSTREGKKVMKCLLGDYESSDDQTGLAGLDALGDYGSAEDDDHGSSHEDAEDAEEDGQHRGDSGDDDDNASTG